MTNDITSSPSVNDRARRRALVLGGGGSTGNAWLIGVLAGLEHAGIDPTAADLVVGTSAGATVAAQLAGASPRDLLDDILQAPPPASVDRPRAGAPGVSDHLGRMAALIAASSGPGQLRRTLGAAALERDAAQEDPGNPRWRSIVAARFAARRWPERRTLITAVDARTGEPAVFDRHSGVDLVDAVAASTSSGLPFGIGEARYLDGAFRRNENADLAAGYRRVLVLSPLGGASLTPVEWGQHLAAQVAELREGGSEVETILPAADAEHLFGVSAMDPSLRPPAARAGYEHGRRLAPALAAFWDRP